MKDKQKYAIKLAIDTMGKHVSRYWNTSYGSRKTGVTVGYGEAISILSDMLSNADNEPCCRCDSRKTNAEIVKVDSLEIIVRMIGNKPYYEVKYREVDEKDYSVGYSSYDLKIVLGYIDEYFEIVKSDKHTNADRIRNMSGEELSEFLVGFKNTFGEEYEGQSSCLEWLQSDVE